MRSSTNAALFRGQLMQLRKVTETQHMAVDGDCDVLALAYRYGEACVQVMFIRDGRNIGSRAYYPRLPDQVNAFADDGADEGVNERANQGADERRDERDEAGAVDEGAASMILRAFLARFYSEHRPPARLLLSHAPKRG